MRDGDERHEAQDDHNNYNFEGGLEYVDSDNTPVGENDADELANYYSSQDFRVRIAINIRCHSVIFWIEIQLKMVFVYMIEMGIYWN